MAKKELGFFPASITSIRPDNDAEWTVSFNSLLVGLEEERFHSRLLKRCRRGKSARNALVQDLIELGLDTLKTKNESENAIMVNLDGLPPETISFLSSPQGQFMIRNLILTLTTGMGNGISLPSPILSTAFQGEEVKKDKETSTIEHNNTTSETLTVSNEIDQKNSTINEDSFESEVDTELEKELMKLEVHAEVSSTIETTVEDLLPSVEKKSKFEKWKKRGDIGRS
jgi:hypothetical protein